MKIAILSPLHRTGLSTVAPLFTYCLTWTQQVTTVLSYTGHSDLTRYLGTSELDDKTRSISQLSKLLSAGAISPENITEYCVPLIKDSHLLDTTSSIITPDEKAKLISFVFDRVPTDFVVCEVDTELDDPRTQEILDIADVVVIVFEPYRNSFDAVKRYIEYPMWPKNKKVMYLCNKYDDQVIPLRDITRDFGEKHVNMCKLHYNPWIMKLCESGKLYELLPYVIQKDPRVIDLNNDMKEWMSFLQGLRTAKVRWEG